MAAGEGSGGPWAGVTQFLLGTVDGGRRPVE